MSDEANIIDIVDPGPPALITEVPMIPTRAYFLILNYFKDVDRNPKAAMSHQILPFYAQTNEEALIHAKNLKRVVVRENDHMHTMDLHGSTLDVSETASIGIGELLYSEQGELPQEKAGNTLWLPGSYKR